MNTSSSDDDDSWFVFAAGSLPGPLAQQSRSGTMMLDSSSPEEPLNRVIKLVLLSVVATVASVGNIFVISAVLMEDHLKKRGNVFVVNTALADLVMTGFSIPAATVGLLANLTDWRLVCQIQWSSLLLVSFVSAPSLAATAADARLQIGIGPDRYLGLVTVRRLAFILAVIWLTSVMGLLAFLLIDLGPDLCVQPAALGGSSAVLGDYSITGWHWPLPVAVTSAQVLWPLILTGVIHLCSQVKIRSSKPELTYPFDGSLLRANIGVYLLHVVCWVPLLVASGVSFSRALPLRIFQQLQWLAMSKSCLNPFVYAVCSKHYREAFVSLFHYCCCKTSVSFSRRVRADSLRPPSDVRVHIIPGYNVYSAVAQGPHRSAANGMSGGGQQGHHRDGPGKPMSRPVASKMMMAKGSSSGKTKSSKEVYEL